jgi:GT2 family glycosyltransferase
MPVRNGEPYLDFAVASIVAQTFSNWELIAIDDSSTDTTLATLQKFAASDARIRVLSSGGTGIVDALNLGVAASRADLVARMDADDIAMPDRLARQTALMAANPALAAAGSSALKIDKKGNETGLFAVPTTPAAISAEMRVRNPFIHPTMIMRKAAVEKAGIYRPGCTYAEDYDLWLRLEETGSLANFAEPTVRFRVHGAQTSKTKRLKQRAATALARQAAWRRRDNKSEGADLANTLGECCAEMLSTRADDPDKILENDGGDLAVMLRLAHMRVPKQVVATLLKRMQSEAMLKKPWLLRLRLTLSGRRNYFAMSSNRGGSNS